MLTLNTTVNEKYGQPLTGSDWNGLPVRVGHFVGAGTLQDLTTDTDTVLVWSGGVSEVRIDEVRQGGLAATDRRRDFIRHPGAIDLLPRGTCFKQITWRGEAAECVAVNLSKETLGVLLSGDSAALDPGDGARFGLVDAHVVDLVKRLQRQAATGQPLGATYVQGLSIALAAYVTGRYGQRHETAISEQGLTGFSRAQVRAFIEEHLSHNFGLVDLAALAGYSPDHFARLFKRSFGTTPHRYVTQRRLEKAKAMLRDRGCSLAGIADACGFSSQAHLNVAFKRHLGVTPGVYRRG